MSSAGAHHTLGEYALVLPGLSKIILGPAALLNQAASAETPRKAAQREEAGHRQPRIVRAEGLRYQADRDQAKRLRPEGKGEAKA